MNNEIQNVFANTNTGEEDIYGQGGDLMIAGCIYFATPFVTFGNNLLTNIEEIRTTNTTERIEEILKIGSNDLANFLSAFHSYSNLFVESVTDKIADLIRRKSNRDDIRGNTTESLALSLRRESFRTFDEALIILTQNLNSLGVQLENVSTLKNAVQGGLAGGALGYMVSNGNSSKGGAVAGALIGAAIAEAEKAKLRQQLIDSSFNGIREMNEKINNCFVKLYDQYISYILGSNINFDKKDNSLRKIKESVNQLTNVNNTILKTLSQSSQLFGNLNLSLEKVKRPVKRKVWYISGFVILLVGSNIASGFEGKPIYDVLIWIVFIGMFAPYLFYKFFLKKAKEEEALRNVPIEAEKLSKSMTEFRNNMQQINTYIKSVATHI